MPQSYQSILDHHIKEMLRFVSNKQSFWCTLDTSYPWLPPCQPNPFGAERLRGCVASHRATLVSSRRASWLLHCLLSSPHCASLSSSCCASWLLHRLSPSSHCAALSSSCRLVVALPLAVLSLCHPLVNLLIQLVVTSPLLVLLLCPASPSRPLVVPAGCCVAYRCAALSSTRRLVMPPLVVLLRQLVVMPSSLVVLSLHRPLVLSSCWLVVALPVLVPPSRPLVVVQRPHHQTPSNAAATIKHHCLRRH